MASFPGGLVVKNPPVNAGDTPHVLSLIQEEYKGRGTTKSMCHNYGAFTLEPMRRSC